MSRFLLVALVIVLQACLTMAELEESSGILERAKEAYRELKDTAVSAAGVMGELVQMFYEDQVKPVTASYTKWAKVKASSFWDSVKNTASSFRST